jgi:negative regulator of flagellin synthesis FlgM
MKITSTGVPALPVAPVEDAPPAPPPAPAPQIDPGERQSAVLQAAQVALRAMPEVDEAKVAAVREALARGEIQFDAAKLAGLIARYHGGRE